MEPFATELATIVRRDHDELLEVAMRVVGRIPEMAGKYSELEIGQLLNGLEAMLIEALEETGDATQTLFLETAIPALVAGGETAASISRSTVTFAILVANELASRLSSAQEEALAWLASFFGVYVCRMVDAAQEAAAT